MDFLLAAMLCFGIFVGYNTQTAGNFNFVCREGEEYQMCSSPCEPMCDNIGRIIRQPNCSRSCVAGCFCKGGLVRANDKTCVLPEECTRYTTIACAENEDYLECGSPCTLNCSNLNDPIFCTKLCHRGCFCKPNFVHDSNGKCIPRRNCPEVAANYQCHINEEYVNCVNFCNTCWASSYCRTPHCEPGCDCRHGYFRNSYGECVTAYECSYPQYDLPPQCDINEVYTSCVSACNDCISRGRCGYLSEYCTSGCDCRSGFFRNERGVCVPEWSCPNQRQPVCPPDEQYYDCIPKCRVTCDSYNNPNFICDTSCTKGCFCKTGLLRNSDGKCVLPRDCPVRNMPCPAGEAFYQCIPTCRTNCKSLTSSSGICSTECRSGCFCQPGFVRNDFGRCVRPQECPTPPSMVCPPREVFYDCIPCKTCEGILPCEICRPGCYCERGLVRRRDGQCVRETECRTVCGLNEEYLSCGSACPATCENFNESRICTLLCIRGCFCKSGFVLGSNENCIQPQNCPLRLTTPSTGGIGGRGGGSNTDDDEKSKTTTAIPTTDTREDEGKNESTVMPSTEKLIPTTASASNETQTEISTVSVSNSTDRATTVIKDATTVLKDATTVIKDATTVIKDATTVIKDATTVQQLEITSPLSTEKVTQTVPPQTSTINNSSKSTSLPTNAAETSTAGVTGGGTVQTTEMVTTISSANSTSSNTTINP